MEGLGLLYFDVEMQVFCMFLYAYIWGREKRFRDIKGK